MKLPDIDDSEIRPEDKDLLQQVAATKVIVREMANSRTSWAGALFEYGTRKRSFRIPLIEEMNRRGWHNQCMVCWHPERENIERDISDATTKGTRIKGYHLIARKYNVSYQSLKGHAGRVPRPGRGETQRCHFSSGPATPILRCPRKFIEQAGALSATELVLYSVLLLERYHLRAPCVMTSPERIERRLGLQLNEHELSIVLNRLGPTGTGLIKDFRREAARDFRIEL